MSTSVSLVDNDTFYDAIAAVRADSQETNWALFGHSDDSPNVLDVIGSGAGGLEELVEQLDNGQYMYGLVRLEQSFDMSTTIKFVYIVFGGKDVPFVRRGKFGVVQGAIEELFSPYHVAVEVDTVEEVTQELLETKLQETSGTKSKVLEASEAKVRPERGFTSGTTTKADPTGSTPTKSSHMVGIGKAGSSFGGFSGKAKESGIAISDEVQEAVGQVASDTSEIQWCVAGYEGQKTKNQIVLLGVGGNGDDTPLEQVKSLFPDDHVAYGYLRVTDVVDDISTVKFVYIQWIGESTKIMEKAKSATHKGSVEEVFSPAHVTVSSSSKAELSQRLVLDKVASASGSKKSHLK